MSESKLLQLKLTKPGQKDGVLTLSLKKQTGVVVELRWNSEHDLDTHALLAASEVGKAYVTSFDQVLSTYNPHLPLADDSKAKRLCGDSRAFKTPCGSLVHSGDVRSGGSKSDADEVITVDFARIDESVTEIPIFITIDSKTPVRFSEVNNASIRIVDNYGTVLGEYHLSKEFGMFNAVQMGSLMLNEDDEWEYVAAGSGFSGDFNDILKHFSP